MFSLKIVFHLNPRKSVKRSFKMSIQCTSFVLFGSNTFGGIYSSVLIQKKLVIGARHIGHRTNFAGIMYFRIKIISVKHSQKLNRFEIIV